MVDNVTAVSDTPKPLAFAIFADARGVSSFLDSWTVTEVGAHAVVFRFLLRVLIAACPQVCEQA